MTLIQQKTSLYYDRRLFSSSIFLSIRFSGFSTDRRDQIILILSVDYHDISLAKRKYKARHEAHARAGNQKIEVKQ